MRCCCCCRRRCCCCCCGLELYRFPVLELLLFTGFLTLRMQPPERRCFVVWFDWCRRVQPSYACLHGAGGGQPHLQARYSFVRCASRWFRTQRRGGFAMFGRIFWATTSYTRHFSYFYIAIHAGRDPNLNPGRDTREHALHSYYPEGFRLVITFRKCSCFLLMPCARELPSPDQSRHASRSQHWVSATCTEHTPHTHTIARSSSRGVGDPPAHELVLAPRSPLARSRTIPR